MIFETLIAESMKAQAQAETEKPVIQAYANGQNANAFQVFAKTVKDTYAGNLEEALDHYERFVQAGKSA